MSEVDAGEPRLGRYAAYYFCYYAAIGATTPYLSRWADALGHGGFVIGALMGLWYGSRILAPPLWALLLQRSQRPGHWFVAGSALTLLAFSAFVFAREAWALLVVMAVFGLFYNAVMPQFEAMTLSALGTRTERYGRVRVWGSIGFLLVSGSYGSLLDATGSLAFPWLVLPLLAAMLLAAWPHRHERPLPEPVTASADPADHLWRRPGVRRFLLMALLMQIGFGPFYVFFTLHLQAAGHDGGTVGLLWATGVLIEIALFWHAPRLIARFGAARLLGIAMAVTVVRWLVTAFFATSLPVMLLAQASHALGFAIFHACTMQLMTHYFPGKRQAAGQSLLYGFSSGVGGVLGAGIAA
ncbi:MAG TPA: MFS transporter, partial [Arenimonas sp.]|nr:MFS transporter [Arenimonas sp.]